MRAVVTARRTGAWKALIVLGPALVAPAQANAEDEWLGADKALHFGVSAAIAAAGYGLAVPVWEERWQRVTCGVSLALTLGVAKELYDLATGGDPSWRDIAWDAIGAAAGALLALGIDVLVEALLDDEPAPASQPSPAAGPT